MLYYIFFFELLNSFFKFCDILKKIKNNIKNIIIPNIFNKYVANEKNNNIVMKNNINLIIIL